MLFGDGTMLAYAVLYLDANEMLGNPNAVMHRTVINNGQIV
jgi:hypothetical protein